MLAPHPNLPDVTKVEHKCPSGVFISLLNPTLPSASGPTVTAGLHYRSFRTSLQAAKPSELGGELLKNGALMLWSVWREI